MNYVSLESIKWPVSLDNLTEMKCRLHIDSDAVMDRFILCLLYPFYKNALKNFKKNISEFKEIKERMAYQHTEYYFLYKGKPYYINRKPEGVAVASIEIEVKDKYRDILQEVHKQLEKITDDFSYLALWARLSFATALLKSNFERVIILQKYTSPMFLKSTPLSPLIDDLDRFDRPKDDPVLEKAEKLLTFYVGFNLVCNT